MPQITSFADVQDALRPLYENARTLYNLDVMKSLMHHLGNPQNKLKIVHVAGTSGKTSTAYFCAALLREQGLHVGLTVSPHVDTINERMQFNGLLLPEAEYCKVFSEFLAAIADCSVRPSYFEFLTAMAYWEFARRKVDYAVIEVGMGGEMDATNVISNPDKICVITDIGLDHVEILGDTLAQIAWFKAGIVQPGNHTFMYRQGDDVMQVVRAKVAKSSAQLHEFEADIAIELPDVALFQQRNLGLARQVIDFVNQISGRPKLSNALIQSASLTMIPARLERFMIGNKIVIVDGSHNQQKLTTLLQSIDQLYPRQPMATVCSFVDGPDNRWQTSLETLLPATNSIIYTTFHSEKDYPKSSVAAEKFIEYCENYNAINWRIIHDPSVAYQELLKQPEKLLLITGSFYLLNHIRPLIDTTP